MAPTHDIDGEDSSSQCTKMPALVRKALVPLQLLFGALVLGFILVLLPFFYLLLFVRYKWYVDQRERVIRGLQRGDEEPLGDTEAPRDIINSSIVADHKSMYFTGSAILSTRMMAFGDFDLEVSESVLSNYSGTYSIVCDVATPKEEKEIIHIVQVAAEKGLCIRAMGSLFSWPNIVQPGSTGQKEKKGIVLDMKLYNKMLKAVILREDQVQPDGTAALVTVQSGMKIWQLCELLDKLGYALPVLGNVTGQSVGGVICTGTHGKNICCGTLSSLVQSMRLVLANGKVENISLRDKTGKCSSDPIACAAGVSLGLLGVISTVTLRVVPKHRLAYSISSMPFNTFINSYEELVNENDHIAFIYYPFVDSIRIEAMKKLTEEDEKKFKDRAMPSHSRLSLFVAHIFNYVLFESEFGKWFSPVVWLITRFITLPVLANQASVKKPAIDKSYKVVACNVSLDIEHHEMEYAYDLKVAKEVLLAYRGVFQNLPPNYQYSSLLDIRFSAGDAAWLAASSGRPTIWLDLIRPNVHKNTEFFMSAFQQTIIKYSGRPHFGKENILTKSDLERCFPHYSEFVKVRNELDPEKMFANVYFDSLFGSSSSKPEISRFRPSSRKRMSFAGLKMLGDKIMKDDEENDQEDKAVIDALMVGISVE